MHKYLQRWVWPMELFTMAMLIVMFWYLDATDVLLTGLSTLPVAFLMVLAFLTDPKTRVRYGVVLAVFAMPAFFAVLFMVQDHTVCFNQSLGTTAFDYLYFSYTTYTGLGYGDIAPLSKYCRLLTSLEVMSGWLALAFLAALFVAKFRATTETIGE